MHSCVGILLLRRRGRRKIVNQLIESMGFDAIDAGPLKNARYLEPMGMLNIWFGYMAKRSTGIALNLVQRSQAAATKDRAAGSIM